MKIQIGHFLSLLTALLWASCVWADRFVVTESGVVAGSGSCQAAALEKLVAAAPEGSEFVFPAGRYRLMRAVAVKDKKGLVFRGEEGTVLELHFSPWGALRENNKAFAVRNCSDLQFAQLTITTDNPPNCSGKVVAKDPVNCTYDVKIYDEFPITGWEHFWGTDTYDENGVPDYVIETYDTVTHGFAPDGAGGWREKLTGVHYDVIGPQLIRVKPPHMRKIDFNRLKIGHDVLYRYMIYGTTVFDFLGCRGVTLRDIEIERCGSFGVTVSPPSADFTFERFNMRPPEGSRALYCANADGIHILGLTGHLEMRDCHFDRLGDDCLNIHGVSGEVKAFDAKTGHITCICRNRERHETRLPEGWATKGDRLVVYDPDTLLEKGLVDVVEYANGNGRIAAGSVDVKVGDVLSNEKDFASVHLTQCSFERTRARGILLRSRNMIVEDCVFRGLSLAGVLVSTDFHYWNEAGPTVNTEIRRCLFERCGIIGEDPKMGGVSVNTADDSAPGECPAGVHRDIRLVGNMFRDCGNNGVYMSSTDGVTIRDNAFERCAWVTAASADKGARYDIRLANCANVCAEGNRTDKGESLHLFTEARKLVKQSKGKGR